MLKNMAIQPAAAMAAFPLNQFECDQEHADSHDDV